MIYLRYEPDATGDDGGHDEEEAKGDLPLAVVVELLCTEADDTHYQTAELIGVSVGASKRARLRT